MTVRVDHCKVKVHGILTPVPCKWEVIILRTASDTWYEHDIAIKLASNGDSFEDTITVHIENQESIPSYTCAYE